jgi:hypothetical protein
MTRTRRGSQDRPASVSEGQTPLLNLKKKRDIEKQVKFKAAAEVLAFRSASDGKASYGGVNKIINEYKNLGYRYVTKGTVNHYVKVLLMRLAPLNNVVTFSTTDSNTHNGIVSDLTNPSTGPLTDPTTTTTEEGTTANRLAEINMSDEAFVG